VDGEPVISPEGLLVFGGDDHRVRALRSAPSGSPETPPAPVE
jgi:hypothetical protein